MYCVVLVGSCRPSVLYNKGKTGQHVLLPYSPDYSQSMEIQFMEGDVSFAAAEGI